MNKRLAFRTCHMNQPYIRRRDDANDLGGSDVYIKSRWNQRREIYHVTIRDQMRTADSAEAGRVEERQRVNNKTFLCGSVSQQGIQLGSRLRKHCCRHLTIQKKKLVWGLVYECTTEHSTAEVDLGKRLAFTRYRRGCWGGDILMWDMARVEGPNMYPRTSTMTIYIYCIIQERSGVRSLARGMKGGSGIPPRNECEGNSLDVDDTFEWVVRFVSVDIFRASNGCTI